MKAILTNDNVPYIINKTIKETKIEITSKIISKKNFLR